MPAQSDAFRIARQPVKIRAVETCESLQPGQRTGCIERLRVQLDGRVGGITTGATARMLLQLDRMGRAVRPQKEARALAGRSLHQREPMVFAFEYGQAVIVRTNATRENGIAVEKQMVGRDSCCRQRPGIPYILRRLLRRDVFQNDLQARKVAPQRNQLGVDEDGFAIKQVDIG